MHICPFCGAGCSCFDVESGADYGECLHDCDPIDDDGEPFTAADITECDADFPEQPWGADQQDDPDADEEC